MKTNLDDWDAPLSEAADPETILQDAAIRAADLAKQIEALEGKRAKLLRLILDQFPKDVGTHEKRFGKAHVTVTIGDVWRWNTEKLLSIYGSSPLPDHVQRKLTVDKRRFQSLPEPEQDLLRDALTRSPRLTEVKVVEL